MEKHHRTMQAENKLFSADPDTRISREARGTIERYRDHVRFKRTFIFILLALLIITVLVSASLGAISIPVSTVLSVIARFDGEQMGRIIWHVRMPRIAAALLAGAGLSVAGSVMQSVLRNPLASPYTLGISSAAAFGASFAIVVFQAGSSSTSNIVISNPHIVTMTAFAFSILATGAILLITRFTSISSETLVLAGIAIGAICSAGLTLMQYLADSVQLSHIVTWTFGDLGRASWGVNAITFAVLLPVFLLCFLRRWDLNAMDSGEETAKGLGIRTEALRVLGMALASLISAVIVSFFGIIAFIGLLGPHITRRLIGGDHRYLLVASPLVGAVILLAADTAARLILAPMVLPVGILTSLLGGPLFIYLLLGRPRR